MTFYFGDLLPYFPLMLQALWVSIYITLISMVVGSALGVLVYLGKASSSRLLSRASSAYIEVLRNTPLLVQLYLIYFGLGQVGFNLNPLWAALLGMTLNNSAYTAEIFRAGFLAVPAGLSEAGRALGMSTRQTFRFVLFKPAIRSVFPALTNQFIVLFLFSSVASVISLEELTSILMNLNSTTLRTLEVFTYGGLLYYLTSSIISVGSRVAERVMFRW
jgi:polar amino acid transport system permease protein